MNTQTLARDTFYAIINEDGLFYARKGPIAGFSTNLNDAILFHDPRQAVGRMSELGLQRSNIHKVLVSRVMVKSGTDEYPWSAKGFKG